MIERAKVLADCRAACNCTIEEYKQIHIPKPEEASKTNSNVGPIINSLVDAGNTTMKNTINFTNMKFDTMYSILQNNILFM